MLTELQRRKLIKLFSMYDVCNMGTLKISDFAQVAANLAELRGWRSGSADYESLLNKYMYRWMHMRSEIKAKVNRKIDATISVDEWLAYHTAIIEEGRQQPELDSLAAIVFEVVDADESGHLDRDEWKNLFKVFNIPVVYVEETFKHIDQNQDGTLSQDEVLPLLEEFYISDDPDAPGNKMFGPF
jgi:hypothetical protein